MHASLTSEFRYAAILFALAVPTVAALRAASTGPQAVALSVQLAEPGVAAVGQVADEADVVHPFDAVRTAWEEASEAVAAKDRALAGETLETAVDALEKLSPKAVPTGTSRDAEASYIVEQLVRFAVSLRRTDLAGRAGTWLVAHREATLGDLHVKTDDARKMLAWTHQAEGRFAEAEAMQRRIHENLATRWGPDTVDHALAGARLADSLGRLERLDEARELMETAVRVLTEKEADELAGMRWSLARLCAEQGDVARVGELMDGLLASGPAEDSEDETARARHAEQVTRLGSALAAHDAGWSEKLLTRADGLLAPLADSDETAVQQARYRLARALRTAGRHDEAEAHYDRLIEGMERTHGADHPVLTVMRDEARQRPDPRAAPAVR